jgi:hypothetical protein
MSSTPEHEHLHLVDGRPWTDEEDEPVLEFPPREAVDRLGRSLHAVCQRRVVVRRARVLPSPVVRYIWTEEKDEVVRTMPAPEAARQLGWPLWAVYVRRQTIKVPDGQRIRAISPKGE